MEREDRAREILSRVSYVTIATASSAAEPWSTPVLAALDDSFNVYWTSLSDTQHSQNLKENQRAYISVYDPAICGKDSVQMQGMAAELSDLGDIERAAALLYEKKGKDPRSVDEFIGQSARRMYRFTPSRFWISLDADAKIDPATAKKEIHLV